MLRRQIKYHIVKDDRPAPKQKQSLESILNKTLEFNAYLVWTERWPLFLLNCCKIKLWKPRSKMEYHKPYSVNGSSLGMCEQISAIYSVNICDPPWDLGYFGVDTRTTRSHGYNTTRLACQEREYAHI